MSTEQQAEAAESVKKRDVSRYFVMSSEPGLEPQTASFAKKKEAEIAISKLAPGSDVLVVKGKEISVSTKTVISLGSVGDEDEESPQG
jgi:cation transport ATPase